MSTKKEILSLPAINGDRRIRLFRRAFPDLEELTGIHIDAYAVITERFVVICDTLLCPADMQTVMQTLDTEIAGRQILVINSHADWDHAWGNSYFTGPKSAPILAHHYCRTRMQSQEAQVELTEYQKRSNVFQNVILTPPTLTFTTGLTLYGGDLTLELFPAPGHSSDSSALWLPELRLLLAFDALEAPFPLIESAASVQPMINTLQRFMALQPEYVLCSHSEPAGIALVHQNLAYIQTITQRCATLLLTHRPTEAEMEHPSMLLASPFTEFGGEDDGTPASAFYRQAHEDNIRAIMRWALNDQLEAW